MPHHELTEDGSTWFWYPDKAEEGEPMEGHWVPYLQCYGYFVTIDGIGFYSAADCQAWISEAVKAAPDAPAEFFPGPPAGPSALDEITRLRRALADRDTEIDRLHAELDGMRQVPVEYTPTAALEAAMAVDPAREDGTVLRETGGEKRAFEWKAQAGEWVRIS